MRVDESSSEGAMAEIALALAMAFFAIMVLAMISMGLPATSGLAVADAQGAAQAADMPRRTLIHWRGRWLDASLKPVDPATAAEPALLAVDPALPLSQALEARRAVRSPDVLVATLDAAWIVQLEEIIP